LRLTRLANRCIRSCGESAESIALLQKSKKPVAFAAGFRVVGGGDITSLPGRLDAIHDLGRKRHLADKLSLRVLKAHSLNVLQILTISDNGRGFQVPASPAELAPAGHFGLLGLHERAELIGAHLDIQSSPGHGA
jgi:hypothetical protein